MKNLILNFRKFTLLILFVGLFSQAQHSKIDSLLKAGSLQIYEHPDEAIRIGKQVYDLPESTIRKKIKGLMMISDGYSSKRDYKQAVEYLIKAQNLSNQIENTIVKIQILTKTAIQYQQLRIYDKAIQNLDEAKVMILSYPIIDSVQSSLATNYSIRGFIYKDQLNCDIAIDYFNRGISEYFKVKGSLKNANLSIVSYNKGNCYILLSDNNLARKSFEESIKYAKTIEAKSLQAFAQKGLAEVYTLEGQYDEAIKELEEARRISSQVGDLVLNQGLYKGLSENYLAINQWENYQKFQNLYLEMQNTITASERKSVGISLNQQQKTLSTKLSAIKLKYGLLLASCGLIFVFLIFISLRNYKNTAFKIENLKEKIQKLQQKTISG